MNVVKLHKSAADVLSELIERHENCPEAIVIVFPNDGDDMQIDSCASAAQIAMAAARLIRLANETLDDET